MYDAVADDYCYPGTTALKNKLDLRDTDKDRMSQAKDLTAARMETMNEPIQHPFTAG